MYFNDLSTKSVAVYHCTITFLACKSTQVYPPKASHKFPIATDKAKQIDKGIICCICCLMVKPAFSSPVCDAASSLGILGTVLLPTALAGFPQSPASYMDEVKATQNPRKYHVDHLKTEHSGELWCTGCLSINPYTWSTTSETNSLFMLWKGSF